MMRLDPDALGWTEFWLRIGVLATALTVVTLAAVMTVRIVLDVKTWVGWMVRKARRKEGR